MLASLPLRQVAREMAQEADEALCSVEVDSGGSNTLGSCAPTAVTSRKRTLADAPTPSEIFGPPPPLNICVLTPLSSKAPCSVSFIERQATF